MTKHIIIRKEDEFYGEEGLILKARQHDGFNTDTKGPTIAHDLIEHPVNPHPDKFVDEFMALGAVAYFRDNCWAVQDFATNTRHSLAENIKADIVTLLEYYDGALSDLPTPPISHSRNYIINESIQLAFSELRKNPEWHSVDVSDLTPALRRKLAGWMALGERRFKERFQRHDPYWIGQIFIKIAEAVKQMNQHGGYQFVLTVNFNKMVVDWQEQYDPYNY